MSPPDFEGRPPIFRVRPPVSGTGTSGRKSASAGGLLRQSAILSGTPYSLLPSEYCAGEMPLPPRQRARHAPFWPEARCRARQRVQPEDVRK